MTKEGATHEVGAQVVVERCDVSSLLSVLLERGYRVVGPTVRDGAVVLDDLSSVDDLPVGWGDEQQGGVYRLRHRDDEVLFGQSNGPQNWKKFLFPARQLLWRATKTDDGFEPEDLDFPFPSPVALFGVRACDLQAVAVLDRVFLEGPYRDPSYAAQRDATFVVAVNCTQPGGTCFCASMGTGPRAKGSFDLAATEAAVDGGHHLLVEVGSSRGAEVLSSVRSREPTEAEVAEAMAMVESAAGRMGRAMRSSGVHDLLVSNYEHPHWDEVAGRCLTCGNCTLVCPTCFCNTVEDVNDLTGDHAERWRRWDSCYTLDFSFLHGGSVRASGRSRYRQWLTHKLATWYDQFGTSGCVGCGRCITWCPVGIDLTEEVAAFRGERTPTYGGRPKEEASA